MSSDHVSSIPWQTLRWEGGIDGQLILLDQTKLPVAVDWVCCRTLEDVWSAIRQLQVRGAPAIGVAAAYGVVIGLQEQQPSTAAELQKALAHAITYLSSSRPTAVNLFWALQRMHDCAYRLLEQHAPADVHAGLLREAQAIHDEDRAICRAIGEHGASLLEEGMGVLTHCNAGALATAEYGTALSIIYAAQDRGIRIRVFADETRPLLQGARLTTWELMQRGVDVTLICDSMAGQVMREGKIDAVITGADRIAANGDTANKIGTYSVATLARAHQIPFYIAAPVSTFDLALEEGSQIPIEQRAADEVTHVLGTQVAPAGVPVYNPAFDVTPAELISAIITERGIIWPVDRQQIATTLTSRVGRTRPRNEKG